MWKAGSGSADEMFVPLGYWNIVHGLMHEWLQHCQCAAPAHRYNHLHTVYLAAAGGLPCLYYSDGETLSNIAVKLTDDANLWRVFNWKYIKIIENSGESCGLIDFFVS